MLTQDVSVFYHLQLNSQILLVFVVWFCCLNFHLRVLQERSKGKWGQEI